MQLRPPPVPVRWAIGIVLFVLILAWFLAPNPIDSGDESDPFVGRWLVNGVDPFGVEYSGSLSIAAVGEGYALEWIIGGPTLSGTGEREGSLLRATWRRTIGDTIVAGTATYTVDDAGMLSGVVESPGGTQTGVETGEPAR